MTVIEVGNPTYRRIVRAVKESKSNIVIPIIRYKPVTDIRVGDIVRVRSNYYERGLPSMTCEVVDIKELDPKKDNIPKEEIEKFYTNPYMRRVPRIFIIYVRPISF
jgi:hypothetical protein